MAWLLAGTATLAFNTVAGARGLTEGILDPGSRIAFSFGQAFALSLVAVILAAPSRAHWSPCSLGRILFWTQVAALPLVAAV